VTDIERYFSEQVGADLPKAIAEELYALQQRLLDMWGASVAELSSYICDYIVKILCKFYATPSTTIAAADHSMVYYVPKYLR
jgi:hypothetical protein